MNEIFNLIAEVGAPIAGSIVMGFFIFLVIKQILQGIVEEIKTLTIFCNSLENRARMLLETTRKVRAVWPENLPLAVRLSAADWDENGLTIEDNIQMAKWLKEEGVDIIDCSSGGAAPGSRSSMGNRTFEQPGLAGKIRNQSGIMTMAVGEITRADQAEKIISEGQSDIVLLARELLRDPYWPFHAAKALGVDTKAIMPIQNAFFVG